MTRPRRSAPFPVLVAVALALVACGGASETPSPSVAPSTTPPPATPPASSQAPASGPAGTAGDKLAPDTIALVTTDALRVRTKPGTSGKIASKQLRTGVLVYVIEGPVSANGYQWLHVEPFGGSSADASLPSGWVAAAARDGTPWITPATVPCPPLPVDGPTLQKVGPHTALACFRSQILTFAARLVVPEGMCGLDPPLERTPAWLDPCSNGDLQLAAATGPTAEDPTLAVALDPSVTIPPDLLVPQPIGSRPLLQISGQYGHAAAASCKPSGTARADATALAEIVFSCRLQFVVTKATPLAG